jgi:hypothetical protein
MTTTNYNIYVVNQMTSAQEFWCFLAAPQVSTSGTVYANSSAYLTVVPSSTDFNSFTVPVQYVFEAGASNQAVGLNIKIQSSTSEDVNLGSQWEASFANPALHEGPTLTNYGSAAPTGSLQYETNSYDQSQEGPDRWYGNETFGIETEQGFIGLTWAPVANTTITIMPNLQFYIATGSFQANTLASMTTVSNDSQLVSLNDFDQSLNCTVTLSPSGTWSVAPGMPGIQTSLEFSSLVHSHYLLARAHDSLVTSKVGAKSKLLITAGDE